MPPERRALHLLVPDAGRRRVLVDAAGPTPPALPVLEVELEAGSTTVQAAVEAVRDRLGIASPLVEIHFDYEADPGAGPVSVLTVFEAVDAPPGGLAWQPLDGPSPAAHPGIQPRLDQLVDEWRTGAPPPALRPAWFRPGWFGRASTWIAGCLEQVGRTPSGPPEQIRHWGISAIMRTPTAAGPAWFKAVFPPFAHEPAVTRLLDEAFPGAVPHVLGAHDREGWLLLDDVGGEILAGLDQEGAHDDAAIRLHVSIQRAMAGRLDDLRAAGCPSKPLRALPELLDRSLADEIAQRAVGLDDGRRAAIVRSAERAVGEVAALGLPETLVHQDLHPGNVALAGGRPVIFDWSDAPIAHPLIDAGAWLSWLVEGGPLGTGLEARRERAWRSFVDAWSDVCPPDRLDAARETAIAVANAFVAVSYVEILRAMEPIRRPEHADALNWFVGQLRESAEG